MPYSRFKILTFLFTVCITLASAYGALAQYDDVGTTNTMFYYSGSLGGSEKIEVNLQLNGPVVSGSYIIERTGAQYVFNGRLASDRSGMGLIVFDGENQYIATIEARLISEDHNFGKEIKGRWKSADGKRQAIITLKKVAELASLPHDPEMKLYGHVPTQKQRTQCPSLIGSAGWKGLPY